jgi:hypothetical protein
LLLRKRRHRQFRNGAVFRLLLWHW